jgi:pyruvate, water dikinase
MSELVPLVHAHDRARFGGKAAGLARLLAAGLRVPEGFALEPATLRTIATDARQAWPRARALGAHLALRSSALDEDSRAASFAGQHASVLGVASEAELVDAAARVLGSGPASRAYREARGLGGESVLAAVLQRLVVPVASGVLFSQDPVTRNSHAVIEAAWGLGEAVVSGLVEPDRFVVARDGELIEERIGHKDVRIGLAGEEPVSEGERDRPCLPREVLSALLASVSRCEAAAGAPADVEWAWDGTELWFLQCRAITTL